VIGGDDDDRLSKDFTTEVVDRHLRGFDRMLSDEICKSTRMIRQHTDLDDVVGNLRACRRTRH
jgi:hypothetical protein